MVPPKLEFLMDFAIPPSDFPHLSIRSIPTTDMCRAIKRRLITANGHLLCCAASSSHRPLFKGDVRKSQKSKPATETGAFMRFTCRYRSKTSLTCHPPCISCPSLVCGLMGTLNWLVIVLPSIERATPRCRPSIHPTGR